MKKTGQSHFVSVVSVGVVIVMGVVVVDVGGVPISVRRLVSA